MSYITIEKYESILDALDNEDIDTIISLFKSNEIKPETQLFDAPHNSINDIELLTYLDYVIYYNLTNVIDTFINDFELVIDDEILASTLKLYAITTYNYLIDAGYIPQEICLKEAVHVCNSSIIDSILDTDSDLIKYIDEDDIDCLYSYNIDEETIETISVLFNYDIDKSIFKYLLESLQSCINKPNIEQDIILELISLLITNGVSMTEDINSDSDTEFKFEYN